jgi:hypothetical protein
VKSFSNLQATSAGYEVSLDRRNIIRRCGPRIRSVSSIATAIHSEKDLDLVIDMEYVLSLSVSYVSAFIVHQGDAIF